MKVGWKVNKKKEKKFVEIILKNLNKKFGEDLTDELKEKIQKADEKTIDYIGENLLDITLEQLKEVLK